MVIIVFPFKLVVVFPVVSLPMVIIDVCCEPFAILTGPDLLKRLHISICPVVCPVANPIVPVSKLEYKKTEEPTEIACNELENGFVMVVVPTKFVVVEPETWFPIFIVVVDIIVDDNDTPPSH